MTKLLVTGDWHIRAQNPRYRLGNYAEDQINKIDWIYDLANNESCDAILQAGDMLDNHTIPNNLLTEYIYNLAEIPIYTVHGQHSLRFRQKGNTSLDVIAASGSVTILNEDPLQFKVKKETISIYGTSFNEKIPEVKSEDDINILVIHRMVIDSKKIWEGQTDYITAKALLLKHDAYDLIISGDNHTSFKYGEKLGMMLLNCGSLMRTTTAQRDHKPIVYIINCDDGVVTEHYIPVKPALEVLNLEKADEIKERNIELEAFIAGLSENQTIDTDFNSNVRELLARGVETGVKDIVYELLAE